MPKALSEWHFANLVYLTGFRKHTYAKSSSMTHPQLALVVLG